MGHTLVSGEEFCIQHPISTLLLSPELCGMRGKNKVSRRNIRIQLLSIILEMLHQIKISETYTSEPHHSTKVQLCWHSPMIDLTAPAKNKSQMKLWNPKTSPRRWACEMDPHIWALQHWCGPHLWPGLAGMPAWLLLWCLDVWCHSSLPPGHHDARLNVTTPRHRGVNTTDNTPTPAPTPAPPPTPTISRLLRPNSDTYMIRAGRCLYKFVRDMSSPKYP